MSGSSMQIRHIRQKDIADELGVDRATVTRALKDDPTISAATKKAVREVASRLGYVPNSLGRALATGYHPVIGLVLLGGFYFGIDGIIDALAGSDWSLQHATAKNIPDEECAAVEQLLKSRVAGILYRPWYYGEELPLAGVEMARTRGIPLVVEGMHLEYPGVHQVTFDFYQGVEDALRMLKEQGHTHIGLVYHGITMWSRVFQQAANKLGITPSIMAFAEPRPLDLATLLDETWVGPNRPTALVLSSLPLAIEFDRYRWQHNLRIPDDLGVVLIQYHHTWVPFIQEEYPYLVFDDKDSARTATQVLLHLIEQHEDMPERVLVPGNLRLPSPALSYR